MHINHINNKLRSYVQCQPIQTNAKFNFYLKLAVDSGVAGIKQKENWLTIDPLFIVMHSWSSASLSWNVWIFSVWFARIVFFHLLIIDSSSKL